MLCAYNIEVVVVGTFCSLIGMHVQLLPWPLPFKKSKVPCLAE